MKTPAEMTNGEINRRLQSLRKKSSKINQAFIDAGRGHERPSEIRHETDALSLRYMENQEALDELRREAERRYGPGFTGTLPRQTTRRRKNPMRKKITQKQLNALARGRRTAMANRKGLKKKPARSPRRKNPSGPGLFHDLSRVTTIKLAAPNSTSGNPRRLYLSFRNGRLMALFDEEYDGDMAMPQKLRGTYLGHTYKISPGEYNRLNKIRKVWETTEAGAALLENPAHGNYLNAIAAAERGGLGREAYQNPVRPLRKNMLPLRNKPIFLVARLNKQNKRVEYLHEYGWTHSKAHGTQFPTALAAKKFTSDVLKLDEKLAIVSPFHTGDEIKASMKKRAR